MTLPKTLSEAGPVGQGLLRILKIARTIADQEGEEALSPAHVAEAIQYRTMDRKLKIVQRTF